MSGVSNRKTRRYRKGGSMPSTGTKRVIVEFPNPLLQETEQVASRLEINRSNLIRSAVEQFLERVKADDLRRRLIEGYTANAPLDRQISEDFAAIDSEEL